jgi:uncharacterized protein YndB with AHSA1/START domain
MSAAAPTDLSRRVSRTVTVDAPPQVVFDLLADPRRHPELDGSGSVKGRVSGPARLALGRRFQMRMRIGVPYLISNQVVEFEEGRRIAWRHVGRHVWRYELAPVDGGARTAVTETFDYAPALAPQVLELLRVPERNAIGIERTLERLRGRFARA